MKNINHNNLLTRSATSVSLCYILTTQKYVTCKVKQISSFNQSLPVSYELIYPRRLVLQEFVTTDLSHTQTLETSPVIIVFSL